MTAAVPPKTRMNRKASRVVAGAFAALAAATLMACGPDSYEIPIETPIQPKMDVSPFQRVLVAGFVAGGNEDLDTNQETVRLLRSQLRNKSSLKVIDADVMPLLEIAQDQTKSAEPEDAGQAHDGGTPGATSGDHSGQPLPLPQRIKEEKDLEPYERL